MDASPGPSPGPSPGLSLGAELPPRRILAWGSLVVAVVFLPVPFLTWQAGSSGEVGRGVAAGIAAGVALLFVVAPLWAAWRLFRQRTFVSPEAVTLCFGTRVSRQLRFDDLTEVRAIVEGSLGSATPEIWNKAVILYGAGPDGRRSGIKVTRQQVTTIDPLLVALEPVVGARPDLVKDELARRLLAEYVRDARTV